MRYVCLLALLAVCCADEAYSTFFKQIYKELGSSSSDEVASRFSDQFDALNADGRLSAFLYDMLEIRRADLLTSLQHIDRLGATIDTLLEINSIQGA
jgi:hypothetical protein